MVNPHTTGNQASAWCAIQSHSRDKVVFNRPTAYRQVTLMGGGDTHQTALGSQA